MQVSPTLGTAVVLDYASLEAVDVAPLHAVFSRLTVHSATKADEVIARARGATVILTSKAMIDRQVMDACPELKLILVLATGYNNIDIDAARERGILVYNCQGYSTAAVAQHTMMLLLALATRLPDYHRAVAGGQWQRASLFCLLDYPILELEGKTLGIFGLGELGGAVKRLAEAFGMKVLLGQTPGRPANSERMALAELLPIADAVSLHCPLNDQTRGMIGDAELRMMKPTAFLINTARGGLIDETALAAHLKQGHLGGAATDVLSDEPPKAGNPLLDAALPRLIVTPHCAWGSIEARERVIAQTAENAAASLSGASLRRIC